MVFDGELLSVSLCSDLDLWTHWPVKPNYFVARVCKVFVAVLVQIRSVVSELSSSHHFYGYRHLTLTAEVVLQKTFLTGKYLGL